MSRNRNKKELYKQRLLAAAGQLLTTAGEDDDAEDATPIISGMDLSGGSLTMNRTVEFPLGKGDGVEPSDLADQILFIPITKVDATKREVWGRAAQEVRDHADEIMDYASSKPLFASWIEDAYKRSGGKSKGNVREMHQPIAAGKVIDFQSNDADKAFDIGTKIVDDNAWQKCLEGVLTGFSIGGRYAKRWYDNGLTRYTAEPREISLVDTPAIPTATFRLIKEDGTEEMRKFNSAMGVKQTVVDTTVMKVPAQNAPVQVDAQSAQADPNLGSAQFIAAQNPGAKTIEAPQTVAKVPGAPVEPALPQGLGKAVQDIPNLRHVAEADLQRCGNCTHFRSFDWSKPYCRKFDSQVQYDWLCDAWAKADEHPDDTLIPLAETAQPTQAQPAPEPVAVEAMAQAAKADAPKDDEKDKLEAELKARGARVGIARKEGEPLTPPKGYPTDPNSYADPANWSWPVDKGRASTAVGRYNQAAGKDTYSPREWAVLGRRITRMAGAVTGAQYKFDPKAKNIERVEAKEPKKMDKNIGELAGQARSLMEQAASGGAGAREALDQAMSIMDVMVDTEGSTPASPKPADPQSIAVPGKPVSSASSPSADKANEPPSTPSTPSTPSAPPEPTIETKTPKSSVPESTDTPAAKGEAITMNDPIASTNPPSQFNIGVGGESYIKSRMPEFIGLMERTDDVNRLHKAFKNIAQEDQYAFDDLWNASCYELAKMAGFTSGNLGQLISMGPTTFGSGISGRGPSVDLAKAFNATTAPGIYLRRLLALMLPVMNPWRQRVSTVNPTTGSDKAIWRMILGFQSTVLAMAMRSPEAGTSIGSTTGSGVPVDETPVTFTASYQSIKLNNAVTGKSLYTMRGYDDPVTVALLETLTGILRVEEMQNIIGNYAAVAKPASVTVTPSTASGAVPASNYIVRVTALNGQGWRLTQEIASYIGGGTYTINGVSQPTVGESDPRASGTETLGSTGRLDVVWPSVPGAAAYNVYVRDDTGATEHWYATVTAPKVSITAYPSAGNAGVSIPDTTANTLGFEGVSQWCSLATVYSQAIPQKSSVVVDAAGAALTLVAPNSITQLDSIIGQMFTKWHIAPTLLMMSPNTTNHLTAKVGSATNPPQLIVIQQGPAQGQVIGGLAATGYINRFSPWLSNAPSIIPILAHPYLPDGQINVLCESIPYPNAREGRGWTLETLRPYTYWPIAAQTDAMPFMIVADELLECNHPSAQGQIYGIDVS